MVEINFFRPTTTIGIKKDDFKIALIGKIAEIKEGYFLLEDEYGRIKIHYNPADQNFSKLKDGELIKVFCTKIDEELYCEFFQNLEGLDLNLLRKIEDLYFKLL